MHELLFAALLIFAGFVGLVWSADRFVGASAAIAKLAGMSPLLIGLTIVSLGTSAPEIMVSAIAALKNNGDLAVGNALGSNLANIGLVLGVTALIARLPIQGHLLKCELPILLLVTAIAGYTLMDAELNLLDGIILLGCLVPVMLIIIRTKTHSGSKEELDAEVEDIPEMSQKSAWVWFVIGLVVLVASANILVRGAETTALYFGVSPLIVGLTVMAIGTSLPELAASVASALKGHLDIALGNIIGSNIFNLLAVMAVPGLIQTTIIEPAAFSRDYLAMAGLTLLLALAMWVSYVYASRKQRASEANSASPSDSAATATIGWPLGIMILCLYVGYFVWLFNATQS